MADRHHDGGDAPVDGFDDVMAFLDPAMVVVTAADGQERDGCLVGFHGQAGIHPRRYVVNLSVANRTFRIAERATHLAVHALTTGDERLAERFGGATADDPEVDKLEGIEWAAGPGGVPLLADLPTRFVGRILGQVEVPDGDHVGMVLEPVEADTGDTADGRADGTVPLRLHHVTDIDAGHDA